MDFSIKKTIPNDELTLEVQLLREAGAMPAECMMTYRGVPLAGKVHEGVAIDDHTVTTAVPRRGWKQSAAGRRARELHEAGRRTYEAIGVPDVAAKRQNGLRPAVVWGCELQGDRGRGTHRAALAALTLAL